MRKTPALFAAALVSFVTGTAHADSLDALAKKLAHGVIELENKKVAVLTFPYHDDRISSGSTLLSERLTTCLVRRKELRVLERHLLEQLLSEKKLGQAGSIDSSSLRTLGQLLDADAIVTGTLIDLPDDSTELNARLIRTDTGEVLSAGQAVVKRSWDDLPVPIKPVVIPHSVTSVTSDPIGMVDFEDPVPMVEPRYWGKSRKLSNESFPPGRRRYLANESSRPKYTPAVTKTAVESPAPDFEYPSMIWSAPRSSSAGYYGTDDKPLPPPMVHPNGPLGSVRFEKG